VVSCESMLLSIVCLLKPIRYFAQFTSQSRGEFVHEGGGVEIRSRMRYHVILSTIAHNLYFESDMLGLSRSISRAVPFGVPGDQWHNFLEGAEYPLSPTLETEEKFKISAREASVTG
jgi:hypothetical protein